MGSYDPGESGIVTWTDGEDGVVGAVHRRPDLRVEANSFGWRVLEAPIGTVHGETRAPGSQILIERTIEQHDVRRISRVRSGVGTKLQMAQARAESWLTAQFPFLLPSPKGDLS